MITGRSTNHRDYEKEAQLLRYFGLKNHIPIYGISFSSDLGTWGGEGGTGSSQIGRINSMLNNRAKTAVGSTS